MCVSVFFFYLREKGCPPATENSIVPFFFLFYLLIDYYSLHLSSGLKSGLPSPDGVSRDEDPRTRLVSQGRSWREIIYFFVCLLRLLYYRYYYYYCFTLLLFLILFIYLFFNQSLSRFALSYSPVNCL